MERSNIWNGTMKSRTLAFISLLLLATACSKPDPTKSEQYAALQRRLDAANADLHRADEDVAADKSQIERQAGQAVALQASSEAQRRQISVLQAEERAAAERATDGEAVRAAFADFLTVAFQEDGSLAEQDARCLAEAFVGSAGGRESLLVLAEYAEDEAPTSDQLSALAVELKLFVDCGLDPSELQTPAI